MNLAARAAVHPRPGRLVADDLCFGVEHLVPSPRHLLAIQNLLRQLNEREIVSVLAGPEIAVELFQLAVGLLVDGFAEQAESLARSRFDQR